MHNCDRLIVLAIWHPIANADCLTQNDQQKNRTIKH